MKTSEMNSNINPKSATTTPCAFSVVVSMSPNQLNRSTTGLVMNLTGFPGFPIGSSPSRSANHIEKFVIKPWPLLDHV